MELLEGSFNPEALERLFFWREVSVGWDGRLYDCDFNLALGLPIAGDAPRTIADFDALKLARRSIATGPHCYGCTAGCGSSCRGALVMKPLLFFRERKVTQKKAGLLNAQKFLALPFSQKGNKVFNLYNRFSQASPASRPGRTVSLTHGS